MSKEVHGRIALKERKAYEQEQQRRQAAEGGSAATGSSAGLELSSSGGKGSGMMSSLGSRRMLSKADDELPVVDDGKVAKELNRHQTT